MSSRDAVLAAALILALAGCDRGRPARTADVHDTPPPTPDAALLARAGALENAAMDSLPPGPGKDLLVRACTSCHAASLMTQQHKSAEEWVKTVDKMVGWGAPLAADQKQALIAYLGTLGSSARLTVR
jgi:cytochrome c5